MSFQWLELRIIEEKERRAREAAILARLPGAVEELRESLTSCVEAYTGAFGESAAVLTQDGLRLTVASEGKEVEVIADPTLPGFQVQHEGGSLAVQVGLLPGSNLFYLDVAADKYLSMDELTRKILDRVMFPKLKE